MIPDLRSEQTNVIHEGSTKKETIRRTANAEGTEEE